MASIYEMTLEKIEELEAFKAEHPAIRELFSRNVFGIKPEQLVECELPEPGEELGDISEEAGYSQDDVRNILIPRIKEDIEKLAKIAENN